MRKSLVAGLLILLVAVIGVAMTVLYFRNPILNNMPIGKEKWVEGTVTEVEGDLITLTLPSGKVLKTIIDEKTKRNYPYHLDYQKILQPGSVKDSMPELVKTIESGPIGLYLLVHGELKTPMPPLGSKEFVEDVENLQAVIQAAIDGAYKDWKPEITGGRLKCKIKAEPWGKIHVEEIELTTQRLEGQ